LKGPQQAGWTSRRGFLKTVAAAGAGLALAAYGIQMMSRERSGTPSNTSTPGQGNETKVPSREAMYYEPLRGQAVRCNLCPNRCSIAPGTRGICEVRENRQGKLYTLVYGDPCTYHVDPIEKKPLYHFLPATTAFSIATAGCNLECLYCQNWEISQARPEELQFYNMPPEGVVGLAKKYSCRSIAYTYSEPTIFYEYMYDTSKLAKAQGIRNLDITAGFIEEDPLIELCKVIDAANVDLKGFTEKFYHDVCSGELQPVLDTLVTMKERGVWVEITNLVVPTLNDDIDVISRMCDWIVDNLGTDFPLHFNRFSPRYKLRHLPYTPTQILEKARETAMEKGIKYVYVGNVYGHPAANTYCHSCGELLIQRVGFSVLKSDVVSGRCKYCGARIPGVWS